MRRDFGERDQLNFLVRFYSAVVIKAHSGFSFNNSLKIWLMCAKLTGRH